MLSALKDRKLVLLSGSPRRQQLLREAGFEFEIHKPDIDEDFPATMAANDVAVYLARKKASHFRNQMGNEIMIAADTTVVLGNKILNKPSHRSEAVQMLRDLSGKTHTVITGVCLLSREKEVYFADRTDVSFRNLEPEEIVWYIDNYKPFDKAGAYGVQEWIGMVAIDKLIGSYFNVMGLPVHKVYDHLVKW